MRKLALLLALGFLLVAGSALAETTTDGQRVETELLKEKGALEGRRYFAIEPAFQYTHITSNRLDISGYTFFPVLVVGNIQVEKARKEIMAPSLTMRFGITDLFQADLRVPYIIREDEISRGTGEKVTVDVDADGIGDIEGNLLFHVMKEREGWPGVSAGVKVKSRTGRDPYGIETKTVQVPGTPETGVGDSPTKVPEDLPTGSGHWGFTPYVSFVKTTDPAVLFASFSYFYHRKRDVVLGRDENGNKVKFEVDPSDYFGYSLGMAYALNDNLAISTAFDQKFYDKVKVNGDSQNETDLVLGSLVLGGTYAMNDILSVNLSVGIGLTPDSPDMEVSFRLPFRYSF